MTFRRLNVYIKTLKNKGVYSDKEICSVCKEEFPHDSMNRLAVCTHCATEIENGNSGNHVCSKSSHGSKKKKGLPKVKEENSKLNYLWREAWEMKDTDEQIFKEWFEDEFHCSPNMIRMLLKIRKKNPEKRGA